MSGLELATICGSALLFLAWAGSLIAKLFDQKPNKERADLREPSSFSRKNMRSWKRLIFYLLLNVLVSAATTLAIISLWERNQPSTPNQPGAENVPVETTVSGGDASQAEPQVTQSFAVHIVEFGDTLGSIAEEYNVDIETLLRVNGLTDPTALGVGQQIFVPLPAPGEGTGGSPSPVGEPRQYSSENPQIQIVSVVGAGDLASERAILRHIGEDRLPLANWKLRNSRGAIYTFPNLDLFTGGSVSVHTASGSNTVVDLYWGQEAAAWPPGELVELLDPDGNVHASFVVP